MEVVLVGCVILGLVLALIGTLNMGNRHHEMFGMGLLLMVISGFTLILDEVKPLASILKEAQVVSVECQEEIK